MAKSVENLLKKGKFLYGNGQYKEAKAIYEEILLADQLENRSTVLSNIALCLFNVDEFKECAEKCQEALEADPLNYKAAYRLMLAREKLGQIDLALEAGKKCVEIAKDEKHHLPLISQLTRKWDGYLQNLKRLLETNDIDSSELIKLLELVDPKDVDSKLFIRIVELANGFDRVSQIKCWNFINKCSSSNGHLEDLLHYLRHCENLEELLQDVEVSKIIISLFHAFHFENAFFWWLMIKSIAHKHLVEPVFLCVTNASQNSVGKKSTGHWIQEMHLFFEHLYNLVDEYPLSSKPALISLLKHESISIDILKLIFGDEITRTWIVCMDSLFLSKRDVAREIMCGKDFIKQILSTDFTKEHILLLSKCADFIELRKEMLEDVEGIMRLVKKFGPRSYLVIGKLLIHSKEVEQEISSRLDIKHDFSSLLDLSIDGDELALQSLVFISLHADSKREFLKIDCDKLVKIANGLNTNFQRFLFISFLLNLSMGEDDRKEMDTIMRSKEVSYEEANILGNIHNQLPELAKNIENDYFIWGPQDIASKVCVKILSHDSGILLRILTKWQSMDSLAALFMLYSSHAELRQLQLSCGVMSWMLRYLNSTESNVKRYYGRALIRVCATSNPKLLSYKDSLDAISHIVKYLDDTHELYQYEAALALTNICSISLDTRNRCISCDAWDKFGSLLFSENEMLKAAGMEGWCNLCLDVGGKIHQMYYKKLKNVISRNSDKLFEFNVMLAFVADFNISMRGASAAASALALLSMDLRIARMLTRISNFSNLLEVAKSTMDTGLLERIFTTFSCICQLDPVDDVAADDSDCEVAEANGNSAGDGNRLVLEIDVTDVQDKIKKLVKSKKYPEQLKSLVKNILGSNNL